jgi:hypothetical protein
MRGLPQGNNAWIEVDNPEEMWSQAELLCNNKTMRDEQGTKAKKYHKQHLGAERIRSDLREAFLRVSAHN